MRLSFILRGLWLAGVISACATGTETPPEDDASTSSGGTGGGTNGVACTTDASCTLLADSCNMGQCIEGECLLVPREEGSTCDDRDPCTSTSVCIAGTCQGVVDADCSDLTDQCGVGVCNPVQGCIKEPNIGDSCDDGLFCTTGDTCNGSGECVGTEPLVCGAATQGCFESVCDENADACVEQPITMCMNDDHCCPTGCTSANDKECFCINRAPTATAKSSGGGTGAMGVDAMNDFDDEATCEYHFINNGSTPSGAWIEYEWPALVSIGALHISTVNATSPSCSLATGRNLFSGVVQWWNGTQWVTETQFAGELDDVVIDFPQRIDTTRIRIFDIAASPGGSDSVIYEWAIFPAAGCRL